MKQAILCGGGLDTMATLTWLRTWWTQADIDRAMGNARPAKRTPFYFPWEAETKLVVVDYGQIAFRQELNAVVQANEILFERFELEIQVVHMTEDSCILKWNKDGGKLFGTGENSKLVGRNLGLAQLVFEQMGYQDSLLYCLTNETDIPMPADTTAKFIKYLSEVMQMSEMFGTVQAPLIRHEKGMALTQAYKIWPEIFDVAFSCWQPQHGEPCGSCRHCQRFTHFKELAVGML